MELVITHASIVQLTKLHLEVVKDKVDELISKRLLVRVVPGVFRLLHIFGEARAQSVTTLNDGSLKVQIGDEFLSLSPKEARVLAKSLSAYIEEGLRIDQYHFFVERLNFLEQSVKKLAKRDDIEKN